MTKTEMMQFIANADGKSLTEVKKLMDHLPSNSVEKMYNVILQQQENKLDEAAYN